MIKPSGTSFRPWLDVATTSLTIVVCLVVLAFTAYQWRETQNARYRTSDAIAPVGLTIGTPDVHFGSPALTVLVGLSSTCRYCDESLPALLSLNELALRRPERLAVWAVALEAPDTLNAYLAAKGLGEFRAFAVERDHPLSRIALRTPSVVVADASGVVRASWSGLMTPPRMRQVISEVERSQ